MSDKERAQRIAEGNAEEIRAFICEHYQPVLRFMCHLTRSQEDAEDLTQQTFVKVRESILSFRGSSSLRTWLHKVAFYEYTHWRRRRRFTFRLSEDIATEARYEACIEGAALLDALHQLPPKLREAFLLFEVQDLPLEEIANVLKVPLGTAKSRLRHARLRLRELLEEADEEGVYGEKACEC